VIEGAAALKRFWQLAAALAGLALTLSGLVGCSGSADPPHSARPEHPAWSSRKPMGQWRNDGFAVLNNEWNTSQAGPQMIWANSFHYWGVQSKQPISTSVKTYPCVQRIYANPPLASFSKISSSFDESMPSSPYFDAEAAYDIWLNNYKIEVMIWVDNKGRQPAQSLVGHATLEQRKFAVWQSGSAMYSFVLSNGRQTRGKIDILSFLQWLVHHGYLSASATMTQIDFGWEIASTDGIPLDFTMKGYSLSSAMKRH